MAKEVVEGEGRINFNLLVCVHKNTWICYYQKKTDSRNEGVKGSQGCALAEPGGPCLPTFCSWATRKSSSFHTNHMLAPWILLVQSTGLHSIFLRAPPCSWMTSSSNFLHRNNTHVCWVPWILQVQSVGLPSIFLRVRPFSNQLNYVILFMGNL